MYLHHSESIKIEKDFILIPILNGIGARSYDFSY